jgi:hypothetical protein
MNCASELITTEVDNMDWQDELKKKKQELDKQKVASIEGQKIMAAKFREFWNMLLEENQNLDPSIRLSTGRAQLWGRAEEGDISTWNIEADFIGGDRICLIIYCDGVKFKSYTGSFLKNGGIEVHWTDRWLPDGGSINVSNAGNYFEYYDGNIRLYRGIFLDRSGVQLLIENLCRANYENARFLSTVPPVIEEADLAKSGLNLFKGLWDETNSKVNPKKKEFFNKLFE